VGTPGDLFGAGNHPDVNGCLKRTKRFKKSEKWGGEGHRAKTWSGFLKKLGAGGREWVAFLLPLTERLSNAILLVKTLLIVKTVEMEHAENR